MTADMSDLELVEGRLEGLKILLNIPANERTMTDAELRFAIREVETIRDCMKITAEQQEACEMLDKLCWADIVMVTLGYKEQEDVRFCDGKSCNYCGKFNDEQDSMKAGVREP